MKRNRIQWMVGVLAVGSLLMGAIGGLVARADETKVLKIATLAPEGSSWMKLFHEWGTAIEKRAPGLKVKFYAGGVAGDEKDAVRKMKLGQLNGAAVTAIGLGLIQSEVRVLELPFLFHNYDELDFVRGQLDAEFKKKFEEKGYILLGWGDVGPVRLFSNTPLTKKDDLTQMKFWIWGDDPLVKKFFKTINISGQELGVPDVLPNLQTGAINACYGSPLSTLALQWHSKIKFITSMVMSQSILGANVLTKAAWDGLSKANQDIVMDESKKLEAKLLKTIRGDNDTALTKMTSQGIKVIPTPQPLIDEFAKQARNAAKELEGPTVDPSKGVLYTPEFRAKVERLVAQKRGGGK